MKRETLRHPKTLDLAAKLGCKVPTALGYLTLLWDYTGEVAPRGDIGKWPDAVLASACQWEGDPTHFVTALVSAGWLDADPTNRIIVHDWNDHCESWIKKKLERAKLSFLEVYGSPRQCPDTGQTPDDHFPPIQSNPIQSKPNPSTPADRRSSPRRNGVLANISKDELRDTARVLDWAKQKLGVAELSDDMSLFALAAAETALRKGKSNPPGLFAKIFMANTRGSVTTAAEDLASKRLAEYRSRAGPGSAPEEGSMVEQFKQRRRKLLEAKSST